MADWVYLNGEFIPYERAVVGVEDRGNVFADGIYEVVRFYGGHPLAMDAHMERLARSAQAIRLSPPDLEAIEAAGLELARKNGVADGTLYIQVSRGLAPRQHHFPKETSPTLFMVARSLERPKAEMRERGVACVTAPDVRWARCDIKSVSLLPNVLARQEAHDRGAYEAIFLRDGRVTEGTSSNVFAVKDGRLMTHPANQWILSGITRAIVVDVAAQEGVPVDEEPIAEAALRDVDELFLSGTTTELMPVTSVDGRPVGAGTRGPVTELFQRRYDELVERVRAGDEGR